MFPGRPSQPQPADSPSEEPGHVHERLCGLGHPDIPKDISQQIHKRRCSWWNCSCARSRASSSCWTRGWRRTGRRAEPCNNHSPAPAAPPPPPPPDGLTSPEAPCSRWAAQPRAHSLPPGQGLLTPTWPRGSWVCAKPGKPPSSRTAFLHLFYFVLFVFSCFAQNHSAGILLCLVFSDNQNDCWGQVVQQVQVFCEAWSLGSPWQLGGEPPEVIFFKPS